MKKISKYIRSLECGYDGLDIDFVISELQKEKAEGANIVNIDCDHDGDNREIDFYYVRDMTEDEEKADNESRERLKNRIMKY